MLTEPCIDVPEVPTGVVSFRTDNCEEGLPVADPVRFITSAIGSGEAAIVGDGTTLDPVTPETLKRPSILLRWRSTRVRPIAIKNSTPTPN